jgi:hypothetical protein
MTQSNAEEGVKAGDMSPTAQRIDDGPVGDVEAVQGEADASDSETQARLHATFVRFCEEARMLGLVRARGKGTGKRGDEVVKGIGLI